MVVEVIFVPIVAFFRLVGLAVTEEYVMSSASTIEGCEFRSPQRKLLRFFRKSRDNWKRKCREAKQRWVGFTECLESLIGSG